MMVFEQFWTELSERYNRPKSVPNIIIPKLNEEIRAHLSRKMRSQDIRLQRPQTLLGKAIVPVLQQINLLVKSKQKAEMPSRKESSNLAMDGIKLNYGCRVLRLIKQETGVDYPTGEKRRISYSMLK